jgi:nucleotide-binding universal stress UspA family protein
VSNAGWLEKVGTVESVLVRETQGADLIVISRPHNIDSSDALHAALFHTGLVLYVPDVPGRVISLHRHMAIAWKPRAQALRAVQRSLPWLQTADSVSIIVVEEPDTLSDMHDLIQVLSAHGIAPVVRSVAPLPKEHVADCILREAEVIGADSLVMGAFRFGMVMEWFFGGVTREILERSKLPIFLMH